MAATLKNQRKYLISIGFKIDEGDVSSNKKEIKYWYEQIKALQAAFKVFGEKIPKTMDKAFNTDNVSNYVESSISLLNELGKAHAMTFGKIENGIMKVTRAFGDFIRGEASITKKGMSKYSLSKAEAGEVLEPFSGMSVEQAIAEQNRVYLKEVEGLGDNVQKSQLKLGIQDAIEKSNDQLAKFLRENLDHIEDYVKKSTIAYDSDGKATASWVNLKIGEYQDLMISMKYFTEQLETDDGVVESRIGVRTSQQLSTDNARALQDLKKAMEQQYQLQKKIKEASLSGNNAQVEAYQRQLTELENIINKKKEEYLLITSDKGIDKGSTQISEIEKEIDLRRELDNAIKQDSDTRKEQKSIVDGVQSTLKEYLSVLSNTQKIESSGTEEYGQRMQYNQQVLSRLIVSLSSYGDGLVSINKDTNEAIIDNTKLSAALGNNADAVKKINDVVAEYNSQLKKQQATQLDKIDTAKVNEAVKAYQELKKAEVELEKTRKSGKASADTIQKEVANVNNLKSAVNQYEQTLLSNGRAINQVKSYTEAKTKADREAETQISKLNDGIGRNTTTLNTVSGSFARVTENVVKYNLAQFGLVENMQRAIQTVKDLDESITNIRLVTGESAESARETMNSYADLAKELGATTQAVAEGSLEWLRQGYTAQDANELIRASTMLSTLGMMDSAEASEKLTATLNGYQMSADKAIETVDKLVNVDLMAATSAEEVATSLQYVASQADLAGVSIDKLIGIIATTSETTRLSAESIDFVA